MDPLKYDAKRPRNLPPDVDTVMEIANPAMATVATMQHNCIETLAAFQKDWFAFVNQRWHENLELPAQLATCRSPIEVHQVYLEYWTRAARQYGAEFQHLRDIAHGENPEPAGPDLAPLRAKSSRTAARSTEFRAGV